MNAPRETIGAPATRATRVAVLGAMLGAFASAYLLVDYLFGSGICLTGRVGCDLVRTSPFAYPLRIPMPLLGLAFTLVAVALVMIESGRSIGPWRAATVAAGWSIVGLGVMAVLTGIELVVIRAFCSWCLLSLVASVLLAGGAVTVRLRRDEPPLEAVSSRARRRLAAEVDPRAPKHLGSSRSSSGPCSAWLWRCSSPFRRSAGRRR